MLEVSGGIKYTRRPVDDLVGLARGLGPGAPLPYLELSVSHKGVMVTPHKNNTCNTKDCGMYPIDTISYRVQDHVYTRTLSTQLNPFQCHAFVCDSRQSARHLTFALAAAFKVGKHLLNDTSLVA